MPRWPAGSWALAALLSGLLPPMSPGHGPSKSQISPQHLPPRAQGISTLRHFLPFEVLSRHAGTGCACKTLGLELLNSIPPPAWRPGQNSSWKARRQQLVAGQAQHDEQGGGGGMRKQPGRQRRDPSQLPAAPLLAPILGFQGCPAPRSDESQPHNAPECLPGTWWVAAQGGGVKLGTLWHSPPVQRPVACRVQRRRALGCRRLGLGGAAGHVHLPAPCPALAAANLGHEPLRGHRPGRCPGRRSSAAALPPSCAGLYLGGWPVAACDLPPGEVALLDVTGAARPCEAWLAARSSREMATRAHVGIVS